MPHQNHHPGDKRARMPISRARFHLIPVLADMFAKNSFSGHKIDQTLKENHLTPEDRVLFSELFYGFLRYGHRLMFFVDKFLSQPEKLPDKVKWILAIAFYQKLYLTKVSDHAILHEAVEMTRHFMGDTPHADVVQAVVTKFFDHHHRFQNLDDFPLWVQTSFPEWLCDYLSEMWTPIKFFHMAQALNSHAPTFIRVNLTKISEEKLLLKLTKAGINCVQTSVPCCLLLPDLNIPAKDIPGYHEGLWTIQNMASQRIVRYLEVHEGDVVLDACAGYGGKTLQMAELIRDKTEIHYFDIVEKKMNAVAMRAHSMGFKHVKAQTKFEPIYTKMLIDAPCSGLGTISSHPEIKWFRTLNDLREQSIKQLEVLKNYSQFLLPGGKLLYAVCSIDKNEGEKIIKKFLEDNHEFELDHDFKTPFHDVDYGTYLLPTEKGEAGYFFSRILKK